MDIDNLTRRDRVLRDLLLQSKQWQQLDRKINRILPANLQKHIKAACIEEGCLVLLAANNMAAGRMRMLAAGLLPRLKEIHPAIREVRVKLVPQVAPPPKNNPNQLGTQAVEQLAQTADRLQHHPKLAAALKKLVEKHRTS